MSKRTIPIIGEQMAEPVPVRREPKPPPAAPLWFHDVRIPISAWTPESQERVLRESGYWPLRLS